MLKNTEKAQKISKTQSIKNRLLRTIPSMSPTEEMLYLRNQNSDLKKAFEQESQDKKSLELQIEKLDKCVIYQKNHIDWLTTTLKKKVNDLYGKRSEKLTADEMLSLFNEAVTDSAGPISSKAIEDVLQEEDKSGGSDGSDPTKRKPKNKKTGKKRGRKAIDPSLERINIHLDISESDKECSCCGTQKKFIDNVITEKLARIPARLVVNRYHRKKYACNTCKGKIVIAPVRESIIGKCIVEDNLLAHVVISKYKDHLPLDRQEDIMDRIGIPLKKNTLCNWTIALAERLEPFYDYLLTKLKQSDYIQADETRVRVLGYHDKDKNWHKIGNCYMWLYKSGVGKYLYYKYEQSRSGKHAEAVLDGFKGYLQTDDYAGYNFVEKNKDIKAVRCMAHARRKFTDVVKAIKDVSPDSLSMKVLALMNKLYNVEYNCKEDKLPVYKVLETRKKHSEPIMDQLEALLLENKELVVPKSILATAVNYTLNNWKGLSQYLKNGKLHIDNNLAEQGMKSFAVGRKNWLFNKNERGAKAGAILYSIIWTANAHGVNLQEYLEFLLKKFPKTKNLNDLLPESFIAQSEGDKKSA